MKNWNSFEFELSLKLMGVDKTIHKDLSFEGEFLTLYKESAKDNYHWRFCLFDVYKANFERRFKKYKEDSPDVELLDFIYDEMDMCEPDYSDSSFDYFEVSLKQIVSPAVCRMVSITQSKKLKYLNELKNNTKDNMQTVEAKEEFVDNSQVEKIAYLIELGILDFLDSKLPDNISNANKGKLISKFTGITSSNTSRILSAFNSGKDSDKNYPLKKDTIKSIKAELTKLDLLNNFYPKK